jgi:hypothetical protein
MALQDELRNDLDVEVFNELGKTVTFIKQNTPILNDWGEIEGYNSTSSSIVVVPYDIMWDRKSPQPFGELKEGDMNIAVRYDQSVEKNDIFIIEGDRFKVIEVTKNFLPDNVVTIVRVAREEYQN